MSGQLVFPGMASLTRQSWQPCIRTLERVKSYLRGFESHGRELHATMEYMADKLGMCPRNLSRYFAWLGAHGWLETIQRCARTAIRKVSLIQRVEKQECPISVRSKEATPEAKTLQRRQGFSPLVLIRNVYKAISKKPQAPEDPAFERSLEELDEAVRLYRLGVTS